MKELENTNLKRMRNIYVLILLMLIGLLIKMAINNSNSILSLFLTIISGSDIVLLCFALYYNSKEFYSPGKNNLRVMSVLLPLTIILFAIHQLIYQDYQFIVTIQNLFAMALIEITFVNRIQQAYFWIKNKKEMGEKKDE